MSQLQKLKDKFYSKPIRNDITFAEVETLAKAYGCLIKARGKHMAVIYPEKGVVIPIPKHGKTVGEAYIKQLKNLFDIIDFKEEEQ